MSKTSFAGVSGILDQSMGLAMQSERVKYPFPSIFQGSPLHFDVWHLFTKDSLVDRPPSTTSAVCFASCAIRLTMCSEISVRSAEEVPRRRQNTKRASIMAKLNIYLTTVRKEISKKLKC